MRILLLAVVALLLASTVWGENPQSQFKSVPDPKPDSRPSFTAEREAAALAFVTANHPELSSVLAPLKSMQRSEYESAIRQIFDISERLSRTRDTDAAKYSIDLDDWKFKSRLQLLMAQAGVSSEPAFDNQLNELIERQHDLRHSRALLERDRAADRLRKAEENLAHVTNDRENAIKKQMADAMKNINKAREHFKKRTAKK